MRSTVCAELLRLGYKKIKTFFILSYSHTERQHQRQNPSGTGKTHRAAVAAA